MAKNRSLESTLPLSGVKNPSIGISMLLLGSLELGIKNLNPSNMEIFFKDSSLDDLL